MDRYRIGSKLKESRDNWSIRDVKLGIKRNLGYFNNI